jgi:polysaccharide biosynthesis transport protein
MSVTLGRDPPDSGGSQSQPDGTLIEFDRIKGLLRRQAIPFIICCVIGASAGAIYAFTTVPLFTASAHVLIDDRSVRALEDVTAVSNIGPQDAAVDSQVELIRSEHIALATVDALSLENDPRFLQDQLDPIAAGVAALRTVVDFRTWFPAISPDLAPEATKQAAALRKLKRGMEVRRIARTYVLAINFTSADRGEAARVANGIAEAYLTDQLESKYDSTRRASAWLQERIQDLQVQSREADLAVQKFRSENNLLAAGGTLITEQQLSEVNSQLILARADTARTRARHERIRSIVEAGQSDAIVAEALEQPVFNDLRSRYLDRAKMLTDLTERHGPTHVQVIKVRSDMRQYEGLLFDELRRIAESYLSDLEVAQSRERALEEGLARSMGITAEANQTLVALRELERQAETFRSLHQNFLQRFEEAVQKQSFPITEARIITRASAPAAPSHPNKVQSILMSLMLGAIFGAGIGFLREHNDQSFRTGEQIRSDLDSEFLGFLPVLREPRRGWRLKKAEASLPDDRFRSPPLLRHVVEEPLSSFAETLRAVKVAADIALQDEAGRIIGITSLLPGEGKSTTSKNLATLLCQQGHKTILIDADLRNPGLTRALRRDCSKGLSQLLLGEVTLDQILIREDEIGLDFVPASTRSRISHTSDLLASRAMKELLRQANQDYEYVVVDLPPVGPVVDVRAAADLLSALVFVIKWGETPRRAVRTTFDTEMQIRRKCLGVVLNKADERKVALFAGYGSKDYYFQRYSSYYTS